MKAPILALAILLGGCASMDVSVDVLNPDYTKATVLEAGLRMEANELASGGHRQVDDFLERTFREYDGFRRRCLDEAAEAARKVTPPENQRQDYEAFVQAILRLKDTGIDSVNQEREGARQYLYRRDADIQRIIEQEGAADIGLERLGQPVSLPIKQALLNRRDAIREVAEAVKSYIERSNRDCKQQVASFFQTTGASAPAVQTQQADQANADAEQTKQKIEEVKLTSIIGGGALLNDRLEAFYATNATEDFWSPRYNRAFGSGYFGSTSVAIKLNDTADFSIKGFVFDGRSTAEMVRKVAVQSVGLIAAAYGAPVGLTAPTPQNSSPTTFDTTDLTSDLRTTIAQSKAQEDAYRAALFRIADSVMANWPTLLTGDKTAQDIVKGTFDAYKPVLQNAGTTPKP